MMRLRSLSGWLFLAVAALLAAPLAWTGSARALILVDGICHSDGGSGPSQDAPHEHDQCGLCQLGIGPALPVTAPLARRSLAWRAVTFAWRAPTPPALSRFVAYTSRAPPPPVGA